ncbi:MAG: AAA family ATPase [Candidatus Nanohaloarchaeota archaeon QJJ-7]|nr:AAA family ATPase [Candidatus Nanohaloarchaeota archaeon QJJ-7]
MVQKRLETGVNGLDELLQGGIPHNNTVLLAGPAGSGKTTFALEYLYRGATEHNQTGLYVSFEETKDELINNLPFDWDLQGLIDEEKLHFVKYDPYQYEDIIDLIRTNIKQEDVDRVVIDSITAISLYVENVKDVRKLLLDMNEELKKNDVTTIYTGEIKSDKPEEISRFGVEAFISDGVITLILGEQGAELTNQILIRKMRGTDHDKKIHPFEFKDDGLKVYAEETSLSSEGSGGSEELF